MVVVTAGDVALAQAKEPLIDTDAKDIPVEASVEKALTMKPVLEVAKHGAIKVPNPKAHVVTSKMKQLLNQLAHVLLGGTNAPTLVSESTSVTTIDTGSGSVLPVPTPPMDIREELTFLMVKQFFTTMNYCTELILTG